MRFENIIALRYLVSKKQIGFVTTISVISIVGVTIGVAALIVVLSVFNGFNELVTSILVNFDPHVQVESVERTNPADYDALKQFLDTQPGIKGYGDYVTAKAMIVSRNVNRVVNIKGVDVAKAAEVSGLPRSIKLGKLALEGAHKDGVILGFNLADRLGAVVGDTIAVVSGAGSELAMMQIGQPLIRKFHVVGIYESNNKDYDAFFAFVGIEAARSLFGLDDKIDGIELRLNDPEQAEQLKRRTEKRFGSQFRVFTWYDLHKELYTVMQIERWSAYIILSLIIAVASFNLLGSLTMSVIEKTRDIGILKSLGATAKSVSRVFFAQGIAVGIIGTVFGTALGLGIVYLQERYHLFPLDPTVYIIPAIPVELRITDLFFVSAAAIGLCALATLHPSRRAAALIPSEAIRWE
ncbi:MAG: ABC transporter permease [Ignavibacteriales bacterium]|nr:ABC transporter permease [Ignavibacteriales bacterium]